MSNHSTSLWRDPLFSPGGRFPLGPAHWPYRYCPDRQVAFVHKDDGSTVPYFKHTKPGPTPVTSGTVDGQPGKPPPEEMASPDYQSD